MAGAPSQPRYQDFVDQLASGALYGVFIDDTGSPGLAQTPPNLHPARKTWTAVIVRPHQIGEILEQLPEAIDELHRTCGGTEFHFSDIYSGRRVFKNVDLQVRLAFMRFMSYIIASYDLDLLVQTLDPVTMQDVLARTGLAGRFGPFDLEDPADASLLLLVLRVRQHIERDADTPGASFRLFVDEGRLPNGAAVQLGSYCSPSIADGLMCFGSSSVILPLQMADYAAFVLNRMQLLLGREHLSSLDRQFLQIVQPIMANYRNLPREMIDPDQWPRRFPRHN